MLQLPTPHHPLQITLTLTINKVHLTLTKLQPPLITKDHALIISLHFIVIEILFKLNIKLVEDKDRIVVIINLSDIVVESKT